jgi:hypothetical protein
MFYAQKVTASATAGSRFSCAMCLARTTSVPHHRVASMSTHLSQRQHPRVSQGRAPVPVHPLTPHRPIVIAVMGSEVSRRTTSTSVLLFPCRDLHRMRRMRSYSKPHFNMMMPLVHQALNNRPLFSQTHRMRGVYLKKASLLVRVLNHPCLVHFPQPPLWTPWVANLRSDHGRTPNWGIIRIQMNLKAVMLVGATLSPLQSAHASAKAGVPLFTPP